MRRTLVSVFCFVVLVPVSSAQQQSPTTAAYQTRCASCHGASMTGATGPAILMYVRYHTDAEVRAALTEKHKGLPALADQEIRQILADVRVLAGTNPTMATGGYTGRRGGGEGADVPVVPAERPVAVERRRRLRQQHRLRRNRQLPLRLRQRPQRRPAELLKGYQTGNFIRAMDPVTGKKAWDLPAPAGRSGVLSTAGGLLFLGGGGGLLVVDAKTGKPVWNVNLSQTTNATPMTFMVGGKQYIALSGTGTIAAYMLY